MSKIVSKLTPGFLRVCRIGVEPPGPISDFINVILERMRVPDILLSLSYSAAFLVLPACACAFLWAALAGALDDAAEPGVDEAGALAAKATDEQLIIAAIAITSDFFISVILRCCI